VATLIEVARAFRAMPEAPKRSIVLLAVTGEEKSLLGADYFANRPTIDGEIVSAISIDMFLMLYPLHDVVAFGAEHSSLGALVEDAAREMGIQLSPDFAPEEVLFVRTDHYPFVKKGIPALFLVHGLDSGVAEINGQELMGKWMSTHYHSPKDQMDQNIDFQAGADFAKLNFLLGWKIANAAERPSWNEGDFFGGLFGSERE
jgi:Zn-dependent M28 family amino/carboxypeptidase